MLRSPHPIVNYNADSRPYHRGLLRAFAGAALGVIACTLLAGCGSSSTSAGTTPPPPSTSEPNNCKSTKVSSPAQPAPASNYIGATFSGVVRAGALPLIGSSVQLYAAGTSGNGSAPTALLSVPLTTNANGGFSIATSFTCPYSNSVVYAVARGGHASATGATNAGTVLIAALGACNALKSAQSVVVNEATTVAAAWALAQFLSSGARIGASSTNSTGLTLAAATAANLVDPSTGLAPGATFPLAGSAPVAKLNTLANLLNACITSTGASSSACTQFYSAAATSSGAPSTTLDAALNIVTHPGANVAAVFSLSGGSGEYAPALSSAPSDWTLTATYSGGGLNGPTALSLDSQGNVWAANYFAVASLFSNTGTPLISAGVSGKDLFNSYGGAVDVNDTMWIANEQSVSSVNGGLGSVTLLNAAGNSPAVYTSGGLNFPIAVAFDTSGVAWIVDYGDSRVTLLDSAGAALSGSAGFTAKNTIFPVAIATDSKCNAYVANESSNTITQVLADGSAFTDFIVGNGPAGVAVDASDNVWVANFHDNSVALVSAAGKVLSGSGFTGGALNQPQGIAVDGAGNAWVANYRGPSLTEFAAASSATPGALLSPAAGWVPDAKLNEPYAVAIDASGNIWISNYGSDTITEFIGLAAPVKTPLLGPVRTP